MLELGADAAATSTSASVPGTGRGRRPYPSRAALTMDAWKGCSGGGAPARRSAWMSADMPNVLPGVARCGGAPDAALLASVRVVWGDQDTI